MNNWLKGSFTVALILLIAGCSEQIHAQRCNGDLRFIVRDESGAFADPENVGFNFVRTKRGNSSTEPVIEAEPGSNYVLYEFDSIKTVIFETGCGKLLAEMVLQIGSRVMLLRLHNLPAETNFFVDSLPFQEGRFEIDFHGDKRLEGQELNREGLRDKDGKLLLSGTARAGYLVSANNWKKRTAQQ